MADGSRTAVYPGSFDPVTNGHLDVIARGAGLFDRLIVAVATNVAKQGLFTVPERVEMLRAHTRHLGNVEVDSFTGLVVDYVLSRGSRVILRGLRTVSDFEYEFQMAQTNHSLQPRASSTQSGRTVETIFVMSRPEYCFLSARLIREIAALGGDVGHLVPRDVAAALTARLVPSPPGRGPG